MLLALPLLIVAAILELAGGQRYVAGGSNMLPAIEAGGTFRAEPFTEDRPPAAGDIVVFTVRWPDGGEATYFDRIVGMPGDTVQMVGGVLTVNGAPVGMERLGEVPGTFGRMMTRYRETLANGVSYEILDTVEVWGSTTRRCSSCRRTTTSSSATIATTRSTAASASITTAWAL